VHVEIQDTAKDVTSAPLPKTIGPVDVVRRGVLPARMARTLLPFYARNQASDLTGLYRLDDQNIHAPSTLTHCVDVPPTSGTWVETAPIDFITDNGVVTKVKSSDDFPVRIRARWTKEDTSLNPQFRELRVEVIRRRDNTPLPPDFAVLDAHTFSISGAMTTYTTEFSLNTWWASNHRFLLRCVGRFYRQIQI
jgi:hypothetical protein